MKSMSADVTAPAVNGNPADIGRGDPNACPHCAPAPICLPEHNPECPYLSAAQEEQIE